MKNLNELSKNELINEVNRLQKLYEKKTSFPKNCGEHRETIELFSEGFYSVSMDGVLLDYNIKFCNILGLDSDKNHIGIKLPFIWQNPSDREKFITQIVSDTYLKNYIIRAKKKNGKRIIVKANSSLIKDSEGNAIRIDGTLIDITEEEQTKEKYKERIHYLQSLLNQLQVEVIVIDKDYVIRDVNNTFLSSSSFRREEVIGKYCYEISHGYNSPCHKNGEDCKLQKVFKDNKPMNFTHEHKHKNGSTNWVNILMSPLTDSEGNVTQVIESVQDISDIIKMQKTLRKSEEQYKILADNSVDVLWTMDLQLNFTYVSPSIKELVGFSQEEWIGTNLSYHSTRKEFFNMARRALKEIKNYKKHKSIVFESKLLRKDNTEVPVEITGSILFNENGLPRALQGSTRDITKRKQSEKYLRESLEREMFWSDIVQNANVGVAVGYPDGRFGINNRAYQKITGYSEEELQRIDWNTVLTPPEYAKYERAFLDKLHKTKKPVVYEKEYLKKDGSRIPVELMVNPGFDKKGNIDYYFAFVTDITERKQFLKTLQDRNTNIETILKNLPIGFAINTIDDGEVKFINKGFEEIYGWPADLFTNINIFFEKVFPEPDFRKRMKAKIIEDMESGNPERMRWNNLKIATSSGEVKYVYAINIPLVDQNLMISTVQDVTKRKKAEDELKKHREHLKELVKERTTELVEKNNELERLNELFTGREFRIKELREKIKQLENKK